MKKYQWRSWLAVFGLASVLLVSGGCKGDSADGSFLENIFADLFGGGGSGSGSSGGGSGIAGLTQGELTDLLDGELGGGGGFGGSGGSGDLGNPLVSGPEPVTAALFGGGLAGFALLRRRKSRKRPSRP